MLAERLRSVWNGVVLGEIGRSRQRVREFEVRFPGATRVELARRLIHEKRRLATAGGAVSGLFGVLTLPADLAFVTYLELALIVDIAVLHGVNLKSARAQREVFEVLEYAGGSWLVTRALPRVVSKVAARLAGRGLAARTLPVLAAPVSAALNGRSLARVGAAALRFYGTIGRLPQRAP